MKIILSAAIAFLCFPTFASNPRQEVIAPIQSVVVYFDAAEFTQTKSINLEPGRTEIVFKGLSPKVIRKTIQVSTSENIAILSIDAQERTTVKQYEGKREIQIKDSLKLVNAELKLVQGELDAYIHQTKLLEDNQNMGGKEKAIGIIELKSAADYYFSKIKEINLELSKLKVQENNCIEMVNTLVKELNNINESKNEFFGEISVLVNATQKTNTTILLKYIVGDAGWAPEYDLKSTDINIPIELRYKAKVFNSTGIDWSNIKLKISTADPRKNVAKPELEPWYLNYDNYSSIESNQFGGTNTDENSTQTIRGSRAEGAAYYVDGQKPQSEGRYGVIAKEPHKNRHKINDDTDTESKLFYEEQVKHPVNFERISVSELSVDFDIKTSYTIPSDGKPYIVDVTTYNLPATFRYFCAPKIDKSVYLLARITGWESLDLVEGPANVYFGGTFVGQSYIQTSGMQDTLDLSLGRDNKVIVSRTKQQDLTVQKISGNTRKEIFIYEIAVKNNRKNPLQIEILDQLPVSRQSEIIVEELELSKAAKTESTGELSWKLALGAEETKKIILSYQVKYPKNKNLSFRKTRSAFRAKF